MLSLRSLSFEVVVEDDLVFVVLPAGLPGRGLEAVASLVVGGTDAVYAYTDDRGRPVYCVDVARLAPDRPAVAP
jgi:hypothetical protein